MVGAAEDNGVLDDVPEMALRKEEAKLAARACDVDVQIVVSRLLIRVFSGGARAEACECGLKGVVASPSGAVTVVVPVLVMARARGETIRRRTETSRLTSDWALGEVHRKCRSAVWEHN